MSNRSKKVEKLEALYAIKESAAYKEFQAMLDDVHGKILKNLVRVIHAPGDLAEHNYKVGMLDGIQKARNNVDVIISELERDVSTEEAMKQYNKERKVVHQ